MMESCFSSQPENKQPVVVEDLKKDLCLEFGGPSDSLQGASEVKEHLEVYLRVRPFTTAERHSAESQDCVNVEPPDTVLLRPPRTCSRLSDKSVPLTGQRFHFSKVYGPETSQTDLFDGTVKDLVRHVLEGGNSLVFTYGVTNAGKTFTFLGPDGDAGLLPRSLQLVFRSVEERVCPDMALKPQRCRDFSRLTREQQDQEVLAKRNLLKLLKESEKISASQLCSTSQNSSGGTSVLGSVLEDPVSLDVEADTSFSIWVSFCEIYNENIHDLLEPCPPGSARRPALRLSQDVKGNSFVKDLRWVQVNSAEEALKVMKLGRRNQSFSFTKLNQSSSRSHSIFSIRILRIDQSRVHSISELSLCDLAGSERCAKTQNRGERLKEAGNINTSLLTLGKCINALRHNQQNKLLQHVPFRESKLTHYLQSFFCGRGRACMIVNVNQCASMFDETLNVLKFSAVAQKVVVLKSLPVKPQRSERGVSFLINNADRKALGHRRSSLIGWEHSLEDVQEDEDDEEDDDDDESLMDTTHEEEETERVVVCKKTYQRQEAQLKEQQEQSALLLEERIREEVSSEFSELFCQMEADYNERLEREKEILEERAEKRLEIFKNLVNHLSSSGSGPEEQDKPLRLEGVLDSMSVDLAGIKQDVRTTLGCLEEKSSDPLEARVLSLEHQLHQAQELLAAKTTELEHLQQQSHPPSREQDHASQSQELRISQLMEMCLEKDGIISRLQKILDQQLQEVPVSRKRPGDAGPAAECGPPSKRETPGGAQREPEPQERSAEHWAEEENQEGVLPALEEQTIGKQEALASLEEEKRAKEEELASLEEEKRAKEEELASLEEEKRAKEEERRGREEALASLEEEKRAKEEALASLEEEKRTKEEELASLEEEKRAKEEALASLEEERRGKEEALASLEEERRGREEALATLEEERRGREEALASLEEERRSREEAHMSKEKQRSPREQQVLEQEADSSATAAGAESGCGPLREEILELKRRLCREEGEKEERLKQMDSLEQEMALTKERLEQSQREQQARRRDLLAAAEQAIAEKDAELERRGLELQRLKEASDRVDTLDADLQRRDEETADLREKLADSKRQIQQVHKEVALVRLEANTLRQKLSDAEKSGKQLQTQLLQRDRSALLHSKTDLLYQQACRDLESQQRVMADMRMALSEQETTQQQLEQMIQDLSQDLPKENSDSELTQRLSQSEVHQARQEASQARQEASQAQETLKLCEEKQQEHRRRWMEEKSLLIGQAKEAEERRNKDMRKFAEDRERHAREHTQLESACAELKVKDEAMEAWRRERDVLVSALEEQLHTLLSSNKDKEQTIQQLLSTTTPATTESACAEPKVKDEAWMSERDVLVSALEEQLQTLRSSNKDKEQTIQQLLSTTTPATTGGGAIRVSSTTERTSLGSAGFPSVLESSQISTENGPRSRFPRPEMEISFSPLQPNRLDLRRRGEPDSVTLKICSARKRRSHEMERDDVEVENSRNTGLTPGQEEGSADSRRSRKEGALRRIGGFLQSSPTLLTSRAKKVLSLVSGPSSSSSSSLRIKRSKKQLYHPHISSPMALPSNTIIPEEKDSDHLIIKRRLRSRTPK